MNGHVGIHTSIQLNVHCERCSTSFPSRNARDIHVQRSENHPKCDKCDRRFANEQALRVVREFTVLIYDTQMTNIVVFSLQHLVLSPNHYYCEQCDRDFQTPAGRRLVSSTFYRMQLSFDMVRLVACRDITVSFGRRLGSTRSGPNGR